MADTKTQQALYARSARAGRQATGYRLKISVDNQRVYAYEWSVLDQAYTRLARTDGLLAAMDGLTAIGCLYRVLFMEASTETIIRRYKETRRKHPLATADLSLTEAVERERLLLAPVRQRADYIVDTSTTTLGQAALRAGAAVRQTAAASPP